MEFLREIYLSTLIMVVVATVPLQSAHQFKPARCPTNKIAPHRRIPSLSNRVQGRTFGGAFIDLLSPDGLRPQDMPQNNLQEQPQEDDPDDCGEIEDYDETDLSSVTQKLNRRQGKHDNRFFFGIFQRPQQYPPLTTRTQIPSTSAITTPVTTQRSTHPTIPPFWSGGFFGNNPYRPPRPESPSETNPYLEALRDKPWESVQNYVMVRPGAHLFYWLYYADGTSLGAENKPLIIWIQGGPGLAASGVANFAEIGPLNMDMQPRNHTWVKGRNLLLIDHPVGTGFSYATDKSLLVKNDREIAIDLYKAIKAFFRTHEGFRKTPTYIFGQSYGGKMCPRLGYYLYTDIEKKRLNMNLKGIGVGSGWVDPKESILVYPEFLYFMGAIDQKTYLKSMEIAKKVADYIEKREYVIAGKLHNLLLTTIIEDVGMSINYNNINQPSPYPALERLQTKINKYVKPTISVVDQNREWNYISAPVFNNLLNQTSLVPSTKFLELLLNNTDLKIAVYNGNLDMATPLAGASNWVHKLKWHGAEEFKNAKKYPIKGQTNGFYKKAKQLSFWWIFRSGHWVPEENPVAMAQILDTVIEDGR